MGNEFKRLPQDLLVEALWTENKYGNLTLSKVEELLQKYNLKLKKDKSLDDVRLALGRGLKGAMNNTELALEQIAEEVDKVCIIARWDFAVAKYKSK